MSPAMSLDFAGLSHVGHVRQSNEDAWLARPDLGLWAVADGMGGYCRGDLASRMVVQALDAMTAPLTPRALREEVDGALEAVDAQLRTLADNGPIGTTVAVLLIQD